MRVRSKLSLVWMYLLAFVTLLQLSGFSGSAEQCEVPQNARYIELPPDGGVVVYSDLASGVVSFVTNRSGSFVLQSIEKSGEDLVVEAFVDGAPAWIVVPRSDIWKYKFIPDFHSQPLADHRIMFPLLKSNTMAGTLPCAIPDRREQARSLLERGYDELRTGSDVRAAELLWAGLELDSDNALALYYWAYAAVRPDNYLGPYDGFRQAIELGLPAELDALARQYVGMLETSYPELKEAYELRTKR
ncbi:hypothetical protein [Aminobacter aminovorans]|uniref:hypothetical protein n=1 Tax=Aminobacter aminovorans TaxID=83263 RepID=UPI00285F550A|nr:hypothetical protein [Aminobacter aminovorans]MDR7221674.1 hypothetical protein [Aminobacter aminovorans]